MPKNVFSRIQLKRYKINKIQLLNYRLYVHRFQYHFNGIFNILQILPTLQNAQKYDQICPKCSHIMFNTFEVLQNVTHKIRSVTKLLMGSHWCDVHGNIVFGSILQILPRKTKTHRDEKIHSKWSQIYSKRCICFIHYVTCKKYFYSQTSLFVYCSQYLTILVSIVLMFLICHH